LNRQATERTQGSRNMNIQLVAVGSRPWDYIVGHWGIALLIDGHILFDTFASFRALHKKLNAINVPLEQIQTVVISHDHWDHIGGLWELLARRTGLKVYLPANASADVKQRVRDAGGQVIDHAAEKMIQPNIFLSEALLGGFKEGKVNEQSLVVQTEKGLVIVVGCAHPGVADIVHKAKEVFKLPVYGVIGGFHLMHSNMDDVRACASELKQAGVSMVAPTHCTGWRAENVFKSEFNENFIALREGQNLLFPSVI
jgi:7,8-dihydropterin-6-yl-methyl-4-(beta-D-ribofuranosyl)aminobenzene 5'-phosphate synthase